MCCRAEEIYEYRKIVEKVQSQNLPVSEKEYKILKNNHYPFLKWVKTEEYVSH